MLNAATARASRLLDVSGTEAIKRALKVAVAELHIEAGDAYCQTLALSYAGLATVEHGHPNDGLKMLQYGGVKALDIPPDEQRPVVVGEGGRAAVKAQALANSATVLADLDCWDAADTDLALKRGRLDVAEQFAAASVRRWEGGSRMRSTLSSVVLAEIHVRAGEPRGLQLAHNAVTAAATLSSIRARTKLEPLVAALEARHSSDARELARMARQVAVTSV